jgi:hypothetical protein
MRKFALGVVAGLALGAVTFGIVNYRSVEAQVGAISMGPKNVITWSAVTVNADLTPCVDLAGYQVAVFPDVLPLGTPLRMVEVISDLTSQPCAALFSGLVQGTRIRIAVLSFDTAGNQSPWSESIQGVLDFVAPGTPGKPGCAILR